MRPHIIGLLYAHSPVLPLKSTPRPIPKLADEDVDVVKLAAVMFDKQCSYCGKLTVERGDRYLLRSLCADCRVANLVASTEIAKGKDKKLEDLHPATIQCVVPTYRASDSLPPSSPLLAQRLTLASSLAVAPHDVKWARSRLWILSADLWAQSEVLEELQMEDDGDVEGIVKDGVNAKDVFKTLGHVKRLKRRTWYRNPQLKGAKEVEEELFNKFSPRVREYVLQRQALIKDRNAVRDSLSLTLPSLPSP